MTTLDLMSHSTSAGISSSLVLYTCLMVVVSKPSGVAALGSFSTCSLLLHPWRLWPSRPSSKKDDPTFPAYQSLVVSKISQIQRRRAAAENRRHGMFPGNVHQCSLQGQGAGRGGIHCQGREGGQGRRALVCLLKKVRIFGEGWSARIASVGGETL